MPKPRLPFLHRHRTRHGKSVYYVKLNKRQKGRGVRIRDALYRSEQFMAEYHAAVRGVPITPAPIIGKDGKGTLGWLTKQYRNSRDWCELLSAGTRKQRGPILMHLETTAGDIPLANINRAKVEEGISARTQNQGRHSYDTMRGMFKWAVENEHHDRNPTDGIKVVKDNGDGHLAWPIELIEQYERHWSVGSRERLLFDVYLSRRTNTSSRNRQTCSPRGRSSPNPMARLPAPRQRSNENLRFCGFEPKQIKQLNTKGCRGIRLKYQTQNWQE